MRKVSDPRGKIRPIGSVLEAKYEARWFDSRGLSFPIKAHAEGDTLIAFWGTPETEQGKSVYRLIEQSKVEVVDSVRQKDGTWKEFGRFVVLKELERAARRGEIGGDVEIRRRGDTETRRRGDAETGRHGEKERRRNGETEAGDLRAP